MPLPAVFAVPPVSAVVLVPPVLAVPVPTPPPPAILPSLLTQLKPFKLGVFKDAKDYLDNYDMIQFYLRIPDFSTRRLDGLLVTDPPNVEASQVWEGQLCLALKDGFPPFSLQEQG